MGKMTMGPASDKNEKSRLVQPEPKVIEKIVEVEVEKVVEKEIPVYIEKEIIKEVPGSSKEVIIQQIDNTLLEEMSERITENYVLSDERMSNLEDKFKRLTKECPEKHEDLRKRLESIEASIDIHDKTLVHIRQIQASEEQMYNKMKQAVDKSIKYNKYCMIGIGISIVLSIIATIL